MMQGLSLRTSFTYIDKPRFLLSDLWQTFIYWKKFHGKRVRLGVSLGLSDIPKDGEVVEISFLVSRDKTGICMLRTHGVKARIYDLQELSKGIQRASA